MLLDIGMVMYAALLVLGLWRSLCYYQCCGVWLSFLNYVSLLYVVLVACAFYSVEEFYRYILEPVDSRLEEPVWEVPWLRPFVVFSPVAVCVTVLLSWLQAEAHVFEIRKQAGKDKHDRAVQIIALPAVFAVMVLAAMVPMVLLISGNASMDMLDKPLGIDMDDFLNGNMTNPFSAVQLQAARVHGKSDELWLHPLLNHSDDYADYLGSDSNGKPHESVVDVAAVVQGVQEGTQDVVDQNEYKKLEKAAMWRYETCFYVADLFEAWALYQFGRIMLDLIGESYDRRGTGEELRSSHAAVQSLVWLGTITFVLVCCAQTACSLLPYLHGGAVVEDRLQLIMTSFQVAGFFTSGAAIYNVFIVERAFHRQLAGCSPVLKFLSVKILVSLSFFQGGLIVMLQIASGLLPGMVQTFVRWVPVVGDILNFSQVQMHLFYPALILYECLFTALMHVWAWRSQEDWYTNGVQQVDETTSLLDSSQKEAKV